MAIRAFLSFVQEDLNVVNLFRGQAENQRFGLEFDDYFIKESFDSTSNPKLDIDIYDGSLQEPVDSERSSYVASVIRQKIQRNSVVLCLIGNGTAWRDWVDWELWVAQELGKGICGVRLKDSRGRAMLKEIGAPIAPTMEIDEIVRVIECAAARRS